ERAAIVSFPLPFLSLAIGKRIPRAFLSQLARGIEHDRDGIRERSRKLPAAPDLLVEHGDLLLAVAADAHGSDPEARDVEVALVERVDDRDRARGCRGAARVLEEDGVVEPRTRLRGEHAVEEVVVGGDVVLLL